MVATGRNPIVPVVVMDKQPEDIRLDDVIAAGGQLATAQPLFAVTALTHGSRAAGGRPPAARSVALPA